MAKCDYNFSSMRILSTVDADWFANPSTAMLKQPRQKNSRSKITLGGSNLMIRPMTSKCETKSSLGLDGFQYPRKENPNTDEFSREVKLVPRKVQDWYQRGRARLSFLSCFISMAPFFYTRLE
uniref:Uncharacterized protein n=1 Tax=Salix viminalis TaxID=40686 RepID=A0A6N2NJ12_SALVM